MNRNDLCWGTCILLGILWAFADEPAASAAFFAASFVLVGLEQRK